MRRWEIWLQWMCISVVLHVLDALQDGFAHDLNVLDVLFEDTHIIDHLRDALKDLF